MRLGIKTYLKISKCHRINYLQSFEEHFAIKKFLILLLSRNSQGGTADNLTPLA